MFGEIMKENLILSGVIALVVGIISFFMLTEHIRNLIKSKEDNRLKRFTDIVIIILIITTMGSMVGVRLFLDNKIESNNYQIELARAIENDISRIIDNIDTVYRHIDSPVKATASLMEIKYHMQDFENSLRKYNSILPRGISLVNINYFNHSYTVILTELIYQELDNNGSISVEGITSLTVIKDDLSRLAEDLQEAKQGEEFSAAINAFLNRIYMKTIGK